jgi:ComF family protein
MVAPLARITARLRRRLPRRCAACGVEHGDPLCAGCEADFFPPDAARCERCALRVPAGARVCGACLADPPAFDGTVALADYGGPVAGMVAALKFRARVDLAAVFGALLARRAPPAADALVLAVPLAFERERERGFNQAREIARHYAGAGAPPGDGLLRVRHSPPQQSLDERARRANVRGAFRATAAVNGRRVVVIDDVMTTGATLDEVARVLKRAGATRVDNRVVARTP